MVPGAEKCDKTGWSSKRVRLLPQVGWSGAVRAGLSRVPPPPAAGAFPAAAAILTARAEAPGAPPPGALPRLHLAGDQGWAVTLLPRVR